MNESLVSLFSYLFVLKKSLHGPCVVAEKLKPKVFL